MARDELAQLIIGSVLNIDPEADYCEIKKWLNISASADAEYNMVINEVDVPIVDFETCQSWYLKVRSISRRYPMRLFSTIVHLNR